MTKKNPTPNRQEAAKSTDELTEDQLENVSGGNSVAIVATLPNYTGPKLHAPNGSIAQGDTLDNTLTENGLP